MNLLRFGVGLAMVVAACSPASPRGASRSDPGLDPAEMREAPKPPPSLKIEQRSSDISAASIDLESRLADGAPDPVADAKAAADRGDFGFIERGRAGGELPVGVVCRTPYRQGMSVHVSIGWGGDVITRAMGDRMGRLSRYARAYNQTIVDHPKFPLADLCAAEKEGASIERAIGGLELIGAPARTLARRPLSLHEAARRGSPAQVRAMLWTHNVDELDYFDMTALAWAVAHGRDDIAQLLLDAGAQPRPAGSDEFTITPVLAAISQGRPGLLRKLNYAWEYSPYQVEAALRSNDAAIAQEVFSKRHSYPRYGHWKLPTPDVSAAFIKADGKKAASDVLLLAAEAGDLEIVRMAIAAGGDVNAVSLDGETPLLKALTVYGPGLTPVTQALIDAGADVNLRVRPGRGWDTPFWRAYQRAANSDGAQPEVLRLAVKAGGDATLERKPGVPPVWTVVFPSRGDLTEIIAPPEPLLKLLLEAGMDLNVVYQNKCVLDAVETLTGRQGDVARTLRRLGAKRMSGGACRL